jgi:conjugal transfer pilus assembly protein TraD
MTWKGYVYYLKGFEMQINNKKDELPWQLKTFICGVSLFLCPIGIFLGFIFFYLRKIVFVGEFERTNQIIFSLIMLFFMVASIEWILLLGYKNYFINYFNVFTYIQSEYITQYRDFNYSIKQYFFDTWLFSAGFGCFCALFIFWYKELTKNKLVEEIKKNKAEEKALNNEVSGRRILEKAKQSFGYMMATGKPFDVGFDELNQNAFLFGTTGAGKTVTLFGIADLFISANYPLVFIDGKGDDNNFRAEDGSIIYNEKAKYETLKRMAQKTGKKVFTFNCGDFASYDFLSDGTPSEITSRIVCLGMGSDTSAAEYYTDIDQNILSIIVMILIELGDSITIEAVLELCDVETIKEVSSNLENKRITKAVSYSQHIETKSIAGLKNKLLKIYLCDLYEFLDGEKHGFRLRDVIENNDIAYFSLENLSSPRLAEMMAQLIINDFKSCIKYNINRKPIGLILDEFSVYAGEQAVATATQTRGMGGHTIIASQDVSGIEKKTSKSFVDNMLNNCNFLLVQGMTGTYDRELLAKEFGTYDTFDVTTQIGSQDREGGATDITGMGSVRSIEKPRVNPNDIMKLKAGQGFVKRRTGNIEHLYGAKIAINNKLT